MSVRDRDQLNLNLMGRIEIDSLDQDQTILSIKINVDKKSYLIADNKMGEQLVKHIGRKVYVFGQLNTEPGLEIFEVREFKLI